MHGHYDCVQGHCDFDICPADSKRDRIHLLDTINITTNFDNRSIGFKSKSMLGFDMVTVKSIRLIWGSMVTLHGHTTFATGHAKCALQTDGQPDQHTNHSFAAPKVGGAQKGHTKHITHV